jgi:hypothetical protein
MSILLSSCTNLEYETHHAKFLEKERAYNDALNMQRFPNLPNCKKWFSTDWEKVIYLEKEGMCIARMKRNYTTSNAIPGEIVIKKQNNKNKKSK